MSTPANPLTTQQPMPTMDPAKVAQLVSLFPQAGGAAPAAPAASPVAAGPDLQTMMTQAAQQGMQSYGAESGKVGELGGQVEKLIGAQGAQQLPPTGPRIQHGGGFLHNLGQALQMVSMITKPGQAIFGPGGPVYGPGLREYAAEHETRAKQIAQLTEQEQEHERLASAGAGMVSKPITALGMEKRGAGTEMSGEANLARAQAYAQDVQNKLTVALKGLDLKAIATGSQAALNDARAKLEGVMAQQEPLRTAIEKEGVELGNATRSAVANALASAGVEKDFHLTSLIDSIFGTDLTPAAPQTSTGKTGTGAATPPAKPTKSAAAAAGKMRVKLADGRTGTIDAKEFDPKTMTKVQ